MASCLFNVQPGRHMVSVADGINSDDIRWRARIAISDISRGMRRCGC